MGSSRSPFRASLTSSKMLPPPDLQDDEEVVFAAVGACHFFAAEDFKFASERLRGNKKLALLAVKFWGGSIFELVSDALKGDRELLMESLKYNCYNYTTQVLHCVSQELG